MPAIKYVTFDCYGTLFDWRHGIGSVLKYVLREPMDVVLREFFEVDRTVITRPGFRKYSEVLREVLKEPTRRKGLQYEDCMWGHAGGGAETLDCGFLCFVGVWVMGVRAVGLDPCP